MYYAQSYFCSSHSLSLITMSVTDEKIVPEVEEGELVLEHPNNISVTGLMISSNGLPLYMVIFTPV